MRPTKDNGIEEGFLVIGPVARQQRKKAIKSLGKGRKRDGQKNTVIKLLARVRDPG